MGAQPNANRGDILRSYTELFGVLVGGPSAVKLRRTGSLELVGQILGSMQSFYTAGNRSPCNLIRSNRPNIRN